MEHLQGVVMLIIRVAITTVMGGGVVRTAVVCMFRLGNGDIRNVGVCGDAFERSKEECD